MQAIPGWNSGRMEGVGWRVWGSNPVPDTLFLLEISSIRLSRTTLSTSSTLAQRCVGVVGEWKTMVGELGLRDHNLTPVFLFLGNIFGNLEKNHFLHLEIKGPLD